MKTSTEYQRTTERKPVDWIAHASNSNVHIIGARVRDVSNRGAFLEKVTVHGSPVRGDTVNLDLFAVGSQPTLRTKAVIAWVGKSQKHGCEGIGIRFEKPATIETFA